MAEVNQRLENSRVENMAGRDIHITHIHQHAAALLRNKMVADILQCRNCSPHFEFLINTHAKKAYGSRYFKELSDKELEEMYEFVQHLKHIEGLNQVPKWVRWVVVFLRKKRNYDEVKS